MSTRYQPSDHADKRFRVRASYDGGSVMGAWQRGETLTIPRGSPVKLHDEARYDAATDLVVFRKSDTLVTCYGLEPEHLTNIYGVTVAAAVDAQFGTNYCSRIDPRNLEDTS